MADKVTLLPPVGGSMQVGSVAEPITTVYCQHIHHSDGSTATEILTLAGAQIDANGHLILTLHGGGTLDVGAAKGDTGATPVMSIGTVTTGNPGTEVQATITGTAESPVLNLTIPEGDTGATPQLSVGTVTTGNPGTEVQVTLTGTAESPVLNLTIPKGTTGDTGAGVPAGGTAGQLIAKTESGAEWVAGVLGTALTGMSLSTNSPVTTSDNVLQGIGKLQAQISALTTNAQTDSYTLVLSDAGKLVEIGKATAATLTIPTNATVAFPVGTKIDILQTGAGQVTVAGAGVTINATPGLKLSAQWAAATLVKRATDTWVLIGSLSA